MSPAAAVSAWPRPLTKITWNLKKWKGWGNAKPKPLKMRYSKANKISLPLCKPLGTKKHQKTLGWHEITVVWTYEIYYLGFSVVWRVEPNMPYLNNRFNPSNSRKIHTACQKLCPGRCWTYGWHSRHLGTPCGGPKWCGKGQHRCAPRQPIPGSKSSKRHSSVPCWAHHFTNPNRIENINKYHQIWPCKKHLQKNPSKELGLLAATVWHRFWRHLDKIWIQADIAGEVLRLQSTDSR